ncbi:hypothetical protein [Compostimonas suwonensis]|uniref:Uncharacterized protein n=1 Tax=Compostimonas suwonensis TaxID=1048394 RepID=A0A2M9BBG4_9MICO|nr:hypothetical protein [Compostimonas suwonensis]PJJ55263.1 hypothetical protein CLV54_3401 [Compostimonas suwonensis]
MRKYVLNAHIWGALIGVVTTVMAARKGPRDWRLVLTIIGAGISLAVAIGTVVEESRELEAESDDRR